MDQQTAFMIGALMMLANGGILGLVHREILPQLQTSALTWRRGTNILAQKTRRTEVPLDTLLATWGLSLVLQQAFRSTFGAREITGGIKNLLDTKPPFTAHNVDFAAGAGWDVAREQVVAVAVRALRDLLLSWELEPTRSEWLLKVKTLR